MTRVEVLTIAPAEVLILALAVTPAADAAPAAAGGSAALNRWELHLGSALVLTPADCEQLTSVEGSRQLQKSEPS